MSTLRTMLKTTAAAADIVLRPPPGLVVLIYHRVGRRSTMEVDLPLDEFARQMAALAELHRTGAAALVTLDEGVRRLAERGAPHDPMVAVTFDDGTADFTELAVPVLVEHAVPACMYIATDFVDRGIDFPHDGVPASWSALADAASTGVVDIGSHTHTHALLDRLEPDRIADELDRSIALIGEHIGTAPAHFAYPKAVAGSPAAERAVHARFRTASLAGTRVNRYGCTDPYRLARSPIQVSDGERWFRAKVDGGMRLEDDLRRLLNRRRYAGATT